MVGLAIPCLPAMYHHDTARSHRGGQKRHPRGPRNSLPPSEGAGLRRTPRAPHFPSHSGHSSDRWSSDPGDAPRAPDPGAETNLRGVAAYAARWGGVGRTKGIGFSRSPSLQRAPSNPPALGLGGRRGSTRRPRELAGAVGEGATPCTDGRPSENTPPWTGSHQSSLPNAVKGYPPRELPLDTSQVSATRTICTIGWLSLIHI